MQASKSEGTSVGMWRVGRAGCDESEAVCLSTWGRRNPRRRERARPLLEIGDTAAIWRNCVGPDAEEEAAEEDVKQL